MFLIIAIFHKSFAIDAWKAIRYSMGHGRKHMLAILPTIWSSGFNKGFVLALNYEITQKKLNSSKNIKVHCFLFKINDFLHQFTSMELTEVRMAIH